MSNDRLVFVINPGSTSTKIAFANAEGVVSAEKILHKTAEFTGANRLLDQEELRFSLVNDFFARALPPGSKMAAVVGRGGLIHPVQGGTYRINQQMLDDCRSCRYGEHPANLAALIAYRMASEIGVPALVVDPPTIDELAPAARISGVPGRERVSRFHALNIRCVARLAAARLGIAFHQSALVVAHMGGGISVAALLDGRAVDVNNALLGDGPFSPERAGTVAVTTLLELAFAPGASYQDLAVLFSKRCGLAGYLGSNDLCEIEDRIARGDAYADDIFNAMIFTIGKEIGSRAAVLGRTPDAIVLTGGMARSEVLTPRLTAMIKHLGVVMVIPGELEMEALAAGAFRVLDGIEEAREY